MQGLVSSSARLIVIWFLSCSLRLSCAQIWPNEVSDVLYGRLESNVTLACGKLPARIPVVWYLNHSLALPWHQVTSEGSLVLLRVNHSAQGDYRCYDNQGLLLHSVKLKLGHPPGFLTISCQVPNHTHVRCSWVNSLETLLPAKYNASFRGNNQDWRPCVVDSTNRRCEVDNPGFWQPIHTVRITETNALGSYDTSDSFKLYELLKPNPPQSVMVTEVEGFSTRIKVSWSYPSSWPVNDGFPLLFQIRYRPQGSSYWSEFFTENSEFTIFDALTGYLHQIQVRAQDEVNSDSQWSEWSPVQYVQPWEAATSEPTDEIPEDYTFPYITNPETSTPSHNYKPKEEANLGLVILLVLFSVVIIITVISLIFVMWVKQRRRSQVSKHNLTSMVKMKAMPI